MLACQQAGQQAPRSGGCSSHTPPVQVGRHPSSSPQREIWANQGLGKDSFYLCRDSPLGLGCRLGGAVPRSTLVLPTPHQS